MEKRIVSLILVIMMIVGVMPLWSVADESTLITTVTISLSEMAPQAGVSPYFPTLLAVNGDTALTDRITFYAEWYESTDDLRHSPDQYTELSTEAFVLDMYYNLYVGITAKYGNEIASDCQLIAILPDGSTLESLMFDYDPEYLFAGFDFLFDKTGLPVTTIEVNEIVTFYLDGYELGGEINQIQVYHSSGQIAMNDNYVAGYVILPEQDGKPDDLNFYQEGSFTADSTYWLGIAIQPAEGYSLSNVRGEQFMLDGFDYSQVILDVVSSTEAYVYFKLPFAKVAYDIIFTFGGEDGVLFGYSVPDGTVIEEPAEPGQEGKVFLGWYTEENEKWDFATPVTKDLVLTAKFEDASTILYGDVDGDTKVTAADALEVLKSVVGKVTLTDDQSKAADVDGSGKVDAADALEILKKVVGKIDKFPVEE